MAERTGIEWTDHTFNIAWGCVKVSPGCQFCYADTLSKRYGHDVWGPAKTTPRRTFGEHHWNEPLRWNRAAEKAGERRRVFCCSMCDVFEDHPTIDAERAKLWPLIRATPWLDWQLLTKRPERIASQLPEDWGAGYPNVWLGTSVEDQPRADERIPQLLRVPAVVRFLSCEPLLGAVDLRNVNMYGPGDTWHALAGWRTSYQSKAHGPHEGSTGVWSRQEQGVDWVIVGGESGPQARPMAAEWARALREQCEAYGVPYLFKQWGEHDAAGVRVGKKKAGRVLEGRTWDEMPVGPAVVAP